jgi:flagellar biosynthesis/type III secretory pathway protein FliH
LVLCEAKPTERTLRQEVELIHSSGLPHEVQTELMGVAISVASRRFSRSVLKAIFEKELAMLDAEENLTELFFELGLAQKWLQNPRFSGEIQARAKAEGEAEGRAQGIAEGRAEGRAEGEAEGETKAKREMTLAILTRRFGELPEVLVKRIETADADWCQRLFDRAITASSLSELIESL